MGGYYIYIQIYQKLSENHICTVAWSRTIWSNFMIQLDGLHKKKLKDFTIPSFIKKDMKWRYSEELVISPKNWRNNDRDVKPVIYIITSIRILWPSLSTSPRSHALVTDPFVGPTDLRHGGAPKVWRPKRSSSHGAHCSRVTLQGTNISPKNGILSRWFSFSPGGIC